MSGEQGGLNRYYQNFTLTLSGGRVITLVSLYQRLTYIELLEGLPRYSLDKIEKDRDYAENQHGCPAVTVEASPVPLPLPLAEYESLSRRFGGELTSLAPVTCVARFESASPARGEDADASALVLVWYQDSFALPQGAGLLGKIQQVDWENLAKNYCI